MFITMHTDTRPMADSGRTIDIGDPVGGLAVHVPATAGMQVAIECVSITQILDVKGATEGIDIGHFAHHGVMPGDTCHICHPSGFVLGKLVDQPIETTEDRWLFTIEIQVQ